MSTGVPRLHRLRPGRNHSIGILIIKWTGAIRIQKVQPRSWREKQSLAGFKLNCYTVFISGVRMPVVAATLR